MENTTPGTGSIAGKYVPPKVWGEINDSERIERMRDIIKTMQRTINNLSNQNYKLKEDFAKHDHMNGGMVLPYDKFGNTGLLGLGEVNSTSGFF